ncbi:MAG: hypothetical protein KIT10_15765 [Flavobacteriales bacterium]|nr:hypothetical protein [Flavobacteriales bacterium]
MRYILTILVSVLLAPLAAQRSDPELARAGAKGIFVFTGGQLMRAGGPVTGIRIERRTEGQEEFRKVAELKPVNSAKEIAKGMEKASGLLPYPSRSGAAKPDSLWQRLQRHGSREQLGAGSSDMAALLAVGAVWCDTDVKPGTLYQYRVTVQGAQNQFLSRFTSSSAGSVVEPLVPLFTSYQEHQRRLNLFWACTGTHRPEILEVSRSVDRDPFERIEPEIQMDRRQGDSVWYRITDTTALRHRAFRYVVKGWDLLGNPMPPCDTVYAAGLDATQMPMPYDLSAVGDSTGRRIGISWKLDNAPLVKHVVLQRSTNSVDGFRNVAELSTDRTGFVDEDIRPATSYFYRFVLEYKATHVPMRGVSFGAVAYDRSAPPPVEEFDAEVTDQGVKLTWVHPHPDLLGFHLYRGEGDGPLMLAAPRLPAGSEGGYSYLDTARSVTGGRMYRYAVQAVSTSHVEGAWSDTVAVLPTAHAPVPEPPKGITAQVDVDVAIVRWEDQSGEALWEAYKVVRTRPQGRVDTLWRSTNFLVDTLDADGRPTTYRVISINALGRSSQPGHAVTARARVAPPAAPGGVEARSVGGKVTLLWEPPVSEVVERFDIYRYTRGSDPVKLGSVPAGKPLQFEDFNPVKGKLTFYFVRSVAVTGAESGPSREVGVQL